MPNPNTMADTDTRAVDTRPAAAGDAEARPVTSAPPERCETIEVDVPAWELTALMRAAAAQRTTLSDFMATAATYMALVRLERFDDIEQHDDIVALLEAIPEKPARTSCEVNEMYEKHGQLSPETIAVLNDPDTRPGDIPFQEHDQTIAVHLTQDQHDVLREAIDDCDGKRDSYVLHTSAYVAQLRLGVIETIAISDEEAEWLDALEARPDRDLSSLREFMSRPSPFVES